MKERIKIWAKNRWEGTIFSETLRNLKSIWDKNIIAFMAEMIFTFIISVYLIGIIIMAFLNIFGNGYSFSSGNIWACWTHYGIPWTIVVFLIVQGLIYKCLVLFKATSKRDERGFDINVEHPFGDADFMRPEVMHKRFICEPIETNTATIFGRDPNNDKIIVGQKHPQLKVNRNCFMVAGPSAGKSATFVIPLLLQIMRRGESAIISDPKSELFKYLSELGKALGYEVRLLELNAMFLKNSDPCNFLMYVGEDVDKAQIVANAIINTTTGSSEMFNFWNEGALNLLQAIILRITVGDDYREEEKNLPQLFTYITTHSVEEMENDFEYLPDSHPAKAIFSIYKDGDDVPKKQVKQGLGIKLKLYNSPALKRVLSETKGGIDILNPGRKRCLYFIGSNDQDASMDSVVSLFYTLEYQELVRYADMRKSGELPITVHMVLDEFANMTPIPDFQKKLSTVRSRNIVTYVIVQDINQLSFMYPNDSWRTVMNDMDYFILLKTNDPTTINWWYEMAGEQTKTVKGKRYEQAKTEIMHIHDKEGVSEGAQAGYVMTKHQIRTLKDNELLLMMTQQDILKLHTFYWKDHPYAKFITDENIVLPAQHYPFYRLIEDGIVDEDFDYDNEKTYVIDIPLDDKFIGNDGYDPDAMLGIDKGTRKVAKGLKKKVAKAIKKQPEETIIEKPSKKITEIKVATLTRDEIEKRRQNKGKKQEGQNDPRELEETENINEGSATEKIVNETIENDSISENEQAEINRINEMMQKMTKQVEEDMKRKRNSKGAEYSKIDKKIAKNSSKDQKTEIRNTQANKKPKDRPKLSETAKEVDISQYLSASRAINDAEDL